LGVGITAGEGAGGFVDGKEQRMSMRSGSGPCSVSPEMLVSSDTTGASCGYAVP
jgi:hypothetical protein